MAEIQEYFVERFGQELIHDVSTVAEISKESESMNPKWDWLIYECVRTYRDEVSKFEYHKMKPKKGEEE